MASVHRVDEWKSQNLDHRLNNHESHVLQGTVWHRVNAHTEEYLLHEWINGSRHDLPHMAVVTAHWTNGSTYCPIGHSLLTLSIPLVGHIFDDIIVPSMKTESTFCLK